MNTYGQLASVICEDYQTKQNETFGSNIVITTTGILSSQQKQMETQHNQNFGNLNFFKHGGHTAPINLVKE
jgi:glycerol-3-phosphate dehydrogenase